MTNKTIAFRTTLDTYSHLVRESHRLSLERDENLSVSDLIRESIEEKYPINASNKSGGKGDGKK